MEVHSAILLILNMVCMVEEHFMQSEILDLLSLTIVFRSALGKQY